MTKPGQVWRKLGPWARALARMPYQLQQLLRRAEDVQQALGRIELRQIYGAAPPTRPQEAELRVFSQAGEDGIIQYLIRHLPIERPIFVEFGVEDYSEANTRFLLKHNAWSGLVIDGSPAHIAAIKQDPLYWQYNLKAEHALVDRENIDRLFRQYGVTGDIGLLSIDIDGNDYWVWEALSSLRPRIVVCEYNSLWGWQRAVSTPYDPTFRRAAAHYSHVYFGASLAALEQLGRHKGYALVATDARGSNAFFVRDDLLGGLRARSAEEAYVATSVRQTRDEQGRLTFLDSRAALGLVADMPLVDVLTGATLRVGDLPGEPGPV